jgi:hypothetical protein
VPAGLAGTLKEDRSEKGNLKMDEREVEETIVCFHCYKKYKVPSTDYHRYLLLVSYGYECEGHHFDGYNAMREMMDT